MLTSHHVLYILMDKIQFTSLRIYRLSFLSEYMYVTGFGYENAIKVAQNLKKKEFHLKTLSHAKVLHYRILLHVK